VFLAVAATSARAEDGFVIRQWTPNEGLPTSTVNDIAQAADGYLWVATTGGLARFDGVRFQVFGVGDGLPSSRFIAVLPSADGGIDALTEEGWSCHWDGRRFTATDIRRYLGYAPMVTRASNGALYGASSSRLWRVRDGAVHVYPDSVRWDSRVVRDRAGTIWLTACRAAERDEWQLSIPARLDRDRVRAIGPATTGRGVWLLDPRDSSAVYFQVRGRDAELLDTSLRRIGSLPDCGQESPLAIDAEGRLWLASGPDVVARSMRDGRELLRHRLNLTEPVWRMWIDPDGNLWVCTKTQGLMRVSPSPLQLLRPERRAEAIAIQWARECRDGRVIATDLTWHSWLAGDSRLLATPGGAFANGGGDSWEGDARTRYRIGKGVIEVRDAQGDGGILRRDRAIPLSIQLDPSRSGSIFFAYHDAIHRFHVEGGSLVDSPVMRVPHELRHLFVDREGHLWVATVGGLWRLAPGDTTHFTRGDGLPVDHVRQIHQDADGVMWFGTYGGGLVRLKDGKFATLDRRHGLIEDVVSVVLEDHQGGLWLAGNAGIQHFSRRQANDCLDGRIPRVDAVGLARESGLRNPEGSGRPGLRTRDGRLWFPTFDGLAVVDPRRVRELDRLPPVPHIEAVLVGGQPIARGPRGFVVPAGAGRIVVEYTGIHLRAAEQLRFAYQLEGVDGDWIQAGTSRSASYTSVSPGRHRFRLAAISALGRTSASEEVVSIEVLPHFWQTWWFMALAALAAVSAAALGWRVRDRQLQARAADLQRAVDDRTAELAREKTRTEQALVKVEAQALRLEALDRARSRFFASISHEFRTPLTLMHGPLQDVRSGIHGPLPDDAQGQVGIALDSVARLNRLVDQLLDAARAEAGELRIDKRPRDLVAFLEQLAQSFTPLAERKAIHFSRRLPAGPRIAAFDRDAMEKVFANLLGNAFKFTPSGGHVTLTAEVVEHGATPMIDVSVSDDGPGISAEDLPHVFERFYRAERSVTRVQPGTGLGLALAADLVEQHGGTLRAESAESHGSTFTVRLALLEAAALAGLAPIEESPPDSSAVAALADEIRVSPVAEREDLATNGGPQGEGAPLILVVEDHPDVRAYVARHLRRRWRVTEAADGLQGLAAMRTETPDLVISDVSMPEMDGHALVSALRRDPELDFVPVILLTAAASSESRIAGLEGGADDYLTKPFEMRELLARADQTLQSRQRLRDRIARAAAAATVDGTALAESTTAMAAASTSATAAIDSAFVRRVREVIEARMGDEDFEVDRLAEAMGVGRSLFYEQVRQLFDQTPMTLVMNYRLERAAQMLRAGHGNVGEVAYAVGFRSVAHFSRRFREHHGVTPSTLRHASGN